MNALDVSLAWTPGEQTEVPVLVVYGVLTGSGFVVVLGTALMAWFMSRRAKRKEAGLTRVPKPKRAKRVKAATAAPAPGPDIVASFGDKTAVVGGAHTGPIEVVTASAATGPAAMPTTAAALIATSASATAVPAPRPASGAASGTAAANGSDRPPVRRGPGPRFANEASGEYVMMRAATARAHTVAHQARNTSQEASSLLDTAERVYEEARKAHAESLAGPSPSDAAPEADTEAEAVGDPVPPNGSDADSDEARAALDAYRRGDLSAEEAEQRIREFRTAEVQARQQYLIALAKARAARQAEYVADTAVRALGAETAAAASELAAARDNTRPKRKWLRNRADAAGAPAR